MKNAQKLRAVVVFTAVTPGAESALSTHLDRLTDTDLPFERVPSVHFARFVLVHGPRQGYPGISGPGPALRMTYLLFTAAVNGSAKNLVEDLRLRIGPQVDAIWQHCVNYPGHQLRAQFRAYFAHNTLPVPQQFTAYDHTVAQIRTAVTRRDEHVEFALTAQALADANGGTDAPAYQDELRRMFRARFAGATT